MKKNYFSTLFAALMLFVAMPASAEVKSMSDLFGKWQFTATIETTEAGAAHADKFKNNCEVTIEKASSEYFMAEIAGFAGADYKMSVSGFSAANNTFEVNGPNNANYGIWNGYIAVANEAGEWPFSIWNVEGSVQYGMNFTFDPETKEISVPNFTIVSLDWSSNTTTILASVKNAKMSPTDLDVKDTSSYPDLTGLWTWEGGLREANNLPNAFKVEFAQAGEGKDAWKATFSFNDYDPFTLDATFDGSMVTIPHDSIFFDRENRIRIGTRSSSKEYASAFTFSYNSKTSMSLYDYIYVRRDSIHPETGELVGAFVHQVFDGYITRENPDAFDWSGVYEVTVPDLEDLNEEDGIEFPATFNMVIEKKPGNIYVITEMLGYKELSIGITPADDDESAVINLGGYSGAMLEFIGSVDSDYAYHVITDGNGEPTTLVMTRNEDGTFSLGDFSISYKLYYANSYDPIASLVGAKATKKVFDWAGEYTLSATVEANDASAEFPSEFDVEIKDINGVYYITKFDGDEVYSFNYGGIPLAVSDDAKSATFQSGYLVGGAYPIYTTINSVETTSICMKMDNVGNILMDNFMYKSVDYSNNSSAEMVTYSNVILTRKTIDAAIDEIIVENKVVEGIFDLLGRKHETITTPGLYIVNGKKVVVK